METSKFIPLHFLLIFLIWAGIGLPIFQDIISLNLYHNQENEIARANFVANLSFELQDEQFIILKKRVPLTSMIVMVCSFLICGLICCAALLASLFLYFKYNLSEQSKIIFRLMLLFMLAVAIHSILFVALPLFASLLSYLFYTHYFNTTMMLAVMSYEIYFALLPPGILVFVPVYRNALKKFIIIQKILDFLWRFLPFTSNLVRTNRVVDNFNQSSAQIFSINRFS